MGRCRKIWEERRRAVIRAFPYCHEYIVFHCPEIEITIDLEITEVVSANLGNDGRAQQVKGDLDVV